MFAGFLGERRGDVFQNGFTQNTNMVLTHGQRTPLPDHAGQPLPASASPNRWARPPACRLTWDRASRSSTRTRRSRSRCVGKPASSASSSSFLLEANYIGNKTNHIEITRNINTLPGQYLSTLADARRCVQQPADREHREPHVQPGAGQQPGHLHGNHHLAPDAALALPGLRLQRHQQPRRTPATAGTTASSSPPPSASPRDSPCRVATRSRSGCRPSTC